MAKDPLANMTKEPGQTVPSLQQVDDLHDHLVRLQKQVNEQGKLIEALQLTILSIQESIPDNAPLQLGSFESKVWETVLVGALGAALGPNKVIQDTPKAMQQIVDRAIRLAENGVKAAKDYQLEQERNKNIEEMNKNNDILNKLLT